MSIDSQLRVMTLGGPGTFASQAAQRLGERRAEFGAVSYAPTMEDVWSALVAGRADVVVLTAETDQSGFNPIHGRVAAPGAQVYVVAEAAVPYACALLARPGTRLQDIRRVLGHGSIRQCQRFLAEHLPTAEVVTHGQNSMAAAREVAAGDGTLAVVGTRITAELNGLEILATNVDEGSLGNWWALALAPCYSDTPDRLIVAARCTGDGQLGDLIGGLTGRGWRLRTVYSQPSGQALFEHDYVLALTGGGDRGAVERVLAGYPTARLAGAFRVD
ncbi:MAG TPA: prephenate dehydratase domain-containing protein [Chloroflexota bacterium]|jgi:prephenate dehydratase